VHAVLVARPSAEKKLALHVHDVEPAMLLLLPGHAVHEVEPADDEKVPAGHTERPHPTPLGTVDGSFSHAMTRTRADAAHARAPSRTAAAC
jgi:hypothetical protein